MSSSKRGRLLEQNVFNITLKGFDDNKVLKNYQLDMLIFVQVYRTINKNFEIINRFWKNKREQRNKQKGSLQTSGENCFWSQSVPKTKRSWSDDVSSEASSSKGEVHQKQVQQKLKITRSYSSSGDANLKLQKLFKGFKVV